MQRKIEVDPYAPPDKPDHFHGGNVNSRPLYYKTTLAKITQASPRQPPLSLKSHTDLSQPPVGLDSACGGAHSQSSFSSEFIRDLIPQLFVRLCLCQNLQFRHRLDAIRQNQILLLQLVLNDGVKHTRRAKQLHLKPGSFSVLILLSSAILTSTRLIEYRGRHPSMQCYSKAVLFKIKPGTGTSNGELLAVGYSSQLCKRCLGKSV